MKSPKPAKNQLAFVVHDEHNVPRYYELNRSLLKMLLIGLPTLTFISLACLVAGLVFYMNFINHFKKQDIQDLQKFKTQYEEIAQKLKILQDNNNALEKKMTSASPDKLDALNLIRFTPGQLDQSKSATISIEGISGNKISPVWEGKQMHLKFNLLNNAPESNRQVGFLFVVMQADSIMQIYPPNSFAENEIQITFNRGEIFGFNKLRFVDAIFDFPLNPGKVQFKILLFNKLGDLIFNESIQHQPSGNPQ
ncbi:MAG: hypothetical protein A2381_16770 [Bdellovibrionales bacterium RIFOXYB1_FULL_37_110]|nr:MAG: hypothetical protein A2181_07775 [Bdellovibrionales bacterium RIFOXYA1_FULL_38_20]OFZ50051.1 MAG: hypothetical protein A2417_18605 [Bdellovibrionales bacterium RIFOXYC1_FULL_37_79]OFZ59957.1 MAG: hypothetical protein A2381_16770 [Bdellovibrionales bacterium RIFOXYB1_FULL_37_110]OFZ63928.1 MAG: hypothetical protein A2577_05960 [Bdellovibrionales bacterium RIFOXYD1_FULL_36_51]